MPKLPEHGSDQPRDDATPGVPNQFDKRVLALEDIFKIMSLAMGFVFLVNLGLVMYTCITVIIAFLNQAYYPQTSIPPLTEVTKVSTSATGRSIDEPFGHCELLESPPTEPAWHTPSSIHDSSDEPRTKQDFGFVNATFTTLGATGRAGPTSLGDHYRGQDHEKLVTLQDGMQLFTVPETGNYRIEAAVMMMMIDDGDDDDVADDDDAGGEEEDDGVDEDDDGVDIDDGDEDDDGVGDEDDDRVGDDFIDEDGDGFDGNDGDDEEEDGMGMRMMVSVMMVLIMKMMRLMMVLVMMVLVMKLLGMILIVMVMVMMLSRSISSGAAGGWDYHSLNSSVRGHGAMMRGTFRLQKGEVLKILVGQEGLDSQLWFSSGGGGGTFVTGLDNEPLIIAGGGGGIEWLEQRYTSCDGTTLTSGQKSYLGAPRRPGNPGDEVFAGGRNGHGATDGWGEIGGGGGGLLTNGGSGRTGSGTSGGEGGYAFVNGGQGGRGLYHHADGGFGGGGGAYGNSKGSGGGGGYSGGGRGPRGACECGGGGGSFNAGTDTSGIVPLPARALQAGRAAMQGQPRNEYSAHGGKRPKIAPGPPKRAYSRITALEKRFNRLSLSMSLMYLINLVLLAYITGVLLFSEQVTCQQTIAESDSIAPESHGGPERLGGSELPRSDDTGLASDPQYGQPGSVFRNATFTTLGATGRAGPTSLGDHYRGQDHEKLVTLQNGIQVFTIPETGNYRIEAAGAAGGWDRVRDDLFRFGHTQTNLSMRGRGAVMKGDFHLHIGDVLKILVGQEGLENRAHFSAGGGGGTYVTRCDGTPLIIAGGGGGMEWLQTRYGSCDGTTLTSGQKSYIGTADRAGSHDDEVYAGGSDGHGATEGEGAVGGGGGGFLTNGGSGWEFEPGSMTSGGKGGYAFVNGGQGGRGLYNNADGGFGGGGGAYGTGKGSGGGGGYSGGGRGPTGVCECGGGGGSFNAGTDTNGQNGTNDGPGYVVVKLLQ
ncbi:Hypp1639 [Branchiostoma lanceolatum]|uniref:Hypp1639 protein n=1 Tax=Branchiostoma lanceolatum TaxID=7740 RepID=A0A8K0ELK8_BRALA|nr:Hypp1639 [Branchiostoma lanceolatum]